MKKTILAFNLFLICSCTCFAQGIKFIQSDWETTKKTAREEHKYIFVDLYTSWCGPCKELEKTVFPLDSVGAFMNAKFLSLRFDAEKGYGIKMAKKFMPTSYPTFLVFDYKAKLIGMGGGGGNNANVFLDQIKDLISPGKDVAFNAVSSDIDLPYPIFYNAFYEKRKMPDSATVNTYLKSKDWLTEVNWSVVNTFNRLIPEYDKWSLQHANELQSLYGVKIDTDPLDNLVKQLSIAVENRDLSAFDTTIEKMMAFYRKKPDPFLADRIRFNKLKFYAQTNQKDKFKQQVEADLTESGNKYVYLSVRLLSQESRDPDMLNYALKLLPVNGTNEELYQQLYILYLLNRVEDAEKLAAKAKPELTVMQSLATGIANYAAENSDLRFLTMAIDIVNRYNIPDKPVAIAHYKINFDINSKKWVDMSEAVDELLLSNKEGITGREINEYAIYIIRNTEDGMAVKRAIKWIKPLAISKGELQSVYLYSYAELLYKDHQNPKAIQSLNLILSNAKGKAENTDDAERLLQRIKKG